MNLRDKILDACHAFMARDAKNRTTTNKLRLCDIEERSGRWDAELAAMMRKGIKA